MLLLQEILFEENNIEYILTNNECQQIYDILKSEIDSDITINALWVLKDGDAITTKDKVLWYFEPILCSSSTKVDAFLQILRNIYEYGGSDAVIKCIRVAEIPKWKECIDEITESIALATSHEAMVNLLSNSSPLTRPTPQIIKKELKYFIETYTTNQLQIQHRLLTAVKIYLDPILYTDGKYCQTPEEKEHVLNSAKTIRRLYLRKIMLFSNMGADFKKINMVNVLNSVFYNTNISTKLKVKIFLLSCLNITIDFADFPQHETTTLGKFLKQIKALKRNS